MSLNGPESCGSTNESVPRATSATSPRRRWASPGDDRAEPAGVDQLVAASGPRPGAVARPGGLEQRRGAPRTGVEPAEAPLARLEGHVPGDVAVQLDDVVAHVDLAVVGGDHQRRPGRELGDEVAHQAVGVGQLGVVVLAEAVLVGDLVDALVVGVDERLTGAQQVAHVDEHGGGDAVAVVPHATQVGPGEARAREVGVGDDRRAVPQERLVRLELLGDDVCAAGRRWPWSSAGC